jgi:hypothetical protein
MAARGRPFESGNKFGRGRPRGSRNKITMMAQELINSHSDPLIRTAILRALKGDGPILRALLDRIVPMRRGAPVKLGLLPTETIDDLSKASQKVVKKMASGSLTTTEALEVADLIEGRRKVIETHELAQTIRALELQK